MIDPVRIALSTSKMEIVVIRFLFRVRCHHVLSPADLVSQPLEDPVEHRAILLPPRPL
jgi:hypothetical protein